MVLLTHPTGNAFVRSILEGLDEADLLQRYFTTIATYPGNVFDRLSKVGPLSDFQRRSYSPAIEAVTDMSPGLELGRMAAVRMGLDSMVRHETGVFSVDAVYHDIDRKVAGKVASYSPKVVYNYEDGAYHTFQATAGTGILNLYDLPIGYWRAARKMLTAVINQRPEWASTIPGLNDSDEKLARKDVELKLADHIFVASSFTASTLAEYPGELAPVTVVPYGFPPVNRERKHTHSGDRPLKLLFVGGLSQRKGLAEMFEAVAHFGDRVELTIVGRKPYSDCPILDQYLQAHRYIPSMPHAEILKLMSTQDVLLFPSHFEGFGLVITEAMSQGTPVITTERTAGPDLIEHGETGFLTSAGSVGGLIEQIDRLLTDPALAKRVGQASIERALQRPWSVYGQEMASAVSELIK